MSHRPFQKFRFLASAFLACLTLASTARSQEFPTIERGKKPERAFEIGEIDQVRLFNGALTMAIPIGQRYPLGLGSELSYGLVLTYNSQVWDYISADSPPGSIDPLVTQAWPGRVFNAGLGWRLSLGEYWDSSVSGPGRCSECYVGPDGAQHPFYQTLHPDVADDSTNTLYTRDATYLRLRRKAREIDFPNGEIHRFDDQGRLIKIRDRLGNVVNISYSANSWTINDGLRVHTVNLVNVAHYGKAIGSVVLKTFGGGTATYNFQYAQPQVPRSCLDTDPDTSPTLQAPLLVGVILPDGSSFSMPQSEYHLAGSPASCDNLDYVPSLEGLIKQIKLPTRGKVSWTYQAYNFPVPIEGDEAEDPLWLHKTTGVRTRVMRNASGTALGTWGYAQTLPGGQSAVESITQVRSPLGDRTNYYFKVGDQPDPLYGLPVSSLETAPGRPDLMRSTKVYDCNSSGAGCKLRRTTYLKYRTDAPFPGGPESNPRVEARYTRFHDDSNRWIAVNNSSFDGLGHFRIGTTTSSFPGGTNRTVRTNYNPTRGTYPKSFVMPTSGTPWVLETYDYRYRREGNKTFRTDFCFDTANGFLKRTRVRKNSNGTVSGNDLVTVFTRNAAAQQITEQHYGGDLAPVGTGGLCALGLGADSFRIRNTFQYGSLKTSEYLTTGNGLVFKTVDRTIDRNTGLASIERDSALVKTTFIYDTMGRVTQVKPAQDAWVRYTYTAPITVNAAVRIRSYKNGGFSALLTDEKILFDHFGRVSRELRRLPGGWARRTTNFDALSQVTNVSEWQANASNTAWTRYRNRDPFGRPGYIDPPEGAGHRISFVYTGARVVRRTSKIGTALSGGSVSESSVSVTERYDRHGRLYQVVDGTGTTTYGNDPAGNITSVSLPNQTRFFGYDGRGFQTSERLPEKGASGNGTVTYSRYDAGGNVGRRSDGPMSVEYVYDRAGRLLRARIPGGANLKVFTYGNGIAIGDRSRGKIKTANRYNYVTLGDVNYMVRVRETYTYGGRSGRPSRRVTQTWLDGSAAGSFTQSFNNYDALGNLKSLSYPQCTNVGCTVPSPRTVTFNYSLGRLVSVPGWANAVTYHRNGTMATVAHSNGVTVTQTNDPWSRPRPRSIATSGALNPTGTAAETWSSGNYVYDGTGNIIHIGSGRYTYDSLSRLKSGTLTTSLNGNATANRYQSYVYDVRGNRTSTTTNSVTVNTPTSATTNRLTGVVSYDAGGSLTSWNGNVYEYDRFGKMWRMKAGSVESIYIYTADDERIWTFHAGENRSTWTLRDLAAEPDAKRTRIRAKADTRPEEGGQ